MNREELIAEAARENPQPQYAHINGVEVELTNEEYWASLNDWATMKLEQEGDA